MCGRFYLSGSDKALKDAGEALRVKYPQLPLKVEGEIFPSDVVALLTAQGYLPMRWGFAGIGGKLIINARSETAESKPTFRVPMKENRCLIPADGNFEWKRDAMRQGKPVKYRIWKEEEPIWFAGCFRQENARDSVESTLGRFVILTQPAIGRLKEIHARMPVMLSLDARREWLENGTPALKQTVSELAFEPATPEAGENQTELF